jgi:hypothetical protein
MTLEQLDGEAVGRAFTMMLERQGERQRAVAMAELKVDLAEARAELAAARSEIVTPQVSDNCGIDLEKGCALHHKTEKNSRLIA